MTKFKRKSFQKNNMQELWFFHSALHLVLIDIYMEFIEDIMNRFQFTVQTGNCVMVNLG